MSATWTQHVNPAVSEWLGKPILLVAASTCDLCGRESSRLRTLVGWSHSLGEHMEASICPTCAGDDDD